ncbi:LysR family transcriptional regulator [Actinomycetospora sp. TBRC 11914]|uniref:LysR family transcriptional regulator n=1 Tax=Actinomycetospora sp. TBRC 11914 TaxID=2729387 RepID=UPI00145E4180|nr:LysR family transcriptional regulator [Actinomycetospora sp. TBRC 11914]NMO88955.1 LysR family transcriptional regulator [Actinomycetospora sp. TBRC 11914]
MTLTQLSTFVAVARLGSVRAAATALGVSDSAVSQTLRALRDHFGDPLLERVDGRMELTAGGARLLESATAIVALGAEAEVAVRHSAGSTETLRLVTTAALAEQVIGPLVDAFLARSGTAFDADTRIADTCDLAVLVRDHLADVAFGPGPVGERHGLRDEPVLRVREVVVAAPGQRLAGPPAAWRWAVDPSAAEPGAATRDVLLRLTVPEAALQIHPHQAAAWAAATAGAGASIGTAHLVAPHVRRGTLRVVPTSVTPRHGAWYVTLPRRPSDVAAHFLRFLGTPEALGVMRAPGTGVAPARYRPPVHVGIWS